MSDWHPGIPLEYRDSILTGDAKVLCEALPDASVDLIFTDPVYDRMDDYRWLAQIARRILKPGGALLVWSNGRWHHKNALWLESAELVYRWDFAYVITGGAAPMNGRIIAKTNRLLWFDVRGESVMLDYLADGYAGVTRSRPDMHNHKWTKSPKFTEQALEAFSRQCGVVLDCFCGGGTVPAVCKMLGRHWIAMEIDPDTAEAARQRVLHTQPPLPGLLSESQATMELGV